MPLALGLQTLLPRQGVSPLYVDLERVVPIVVGERCIPGVWATRVDMRMTDGDDQMGSNLKGNPADMLKPS